MGAKGNLHWGKLPLLTISARVRRAITIRSGRTKRTPTTLSDLLHRCEDRAARMHSALKSTDGAEESRGRMVSAGAYNLAFPVP